MLRTAQTENIERAKMPRLKCPEAFFGTDEALPRDKIPCLAKTRCILPLISLLRDRL